jgi:formate--tetrahydrofolate ligase
MSENRSRHDLRETEPIIYDAPMTQQSAAEMSQEPRRIQEIATDLGLSDADVEPVGWYKAKLALGLEQRLGDRPAAKYVSVTAITPTPLGEGKTVTTIGLAMALSRLGKRTIATLREPSLAPVFGIKGGGAGGGRGRLLPFEDINLHFTGDAHAVTAATNLLAAMVDNHVRRGRAPVMDATRITWRRVTDTSDKGLLQVVSGLGGHPMAPLRETGFDLTAASEIMAILALTTGVGDLRERLCRMVVGWDRQGTPVTAESIGCVGSLMALLRDALRPNLVQTEEHTPAIVHTGPFGNIAHGNSSILADLVAVRLADFVITESGFGADCGAEKLFHIKCRQSGLAPQVSVLVCTVRALKVHSGRYVVRPGRPLPAELLEPNLEAVELGASNLRAHVENIRKFGLPVVVAINLFPTDDEREVELVRRIARDAGAVAAVPSHVFARGGEGGIALAEAVVKAAAGPTTLKYLYSLDAPLVEKIDALARGIYGADGIDLSPQAKRDLERFEELGYGGLPVCVAKTQYSLSHDPKLLGRPSGYRLPVREARLSAGAGFVYVLTGDIVTLPGLPSEPAALRIDVDDDGRIRGLT